MKFPALQNRKLYIPLAITLLRLFAAPLIFICFTKCSHFIALLVFLGVWMTDMLDGMAARKLCATSKIGAYADVIADFILMISAFLAFFKLGWYSIFMLLPIGVSFVHFLMSSGLQGLTYDPFGKYMGAIISIIIVITLSSPYRLTREILSCALFAIFILNIALRYVYLRTNCNGRCYDKN